MKYVLTLQDKTTIDFDSQALATKAAKAAGGTRIDPLESVAGVTRFVSPTGQLSIERVTARKTLTIEQAARELENAHNDYGNPSPQRTKALRAFKKLGGWAAFREAEKRSSRS